MSLSDHLRLAGVDRRRTAAAGAASSGAGFDDGDHDAATTRSSRSSRARSTRWCSTGQPALRRVAVARAARQHVVEELGHVLEEEMVPLRPQRARAPRRPDRRRRARLRPDRAVPRRPDRHRGDGERLQLDLHRARRPPLPDRRALRLRRAAPPGDRRIVSAVGRRIDESSPMVDARLADGSRVNAIIPPLAIDGPTLTIRKFAEAPAHGRRPHRVRHADARGDRVPRRRACAAGSTS